MSGTCMSSLSQVGCDKQNRITGVTKGNVNECIENDLKSCVMKRQN